MGNGGSAGALRRWCCGAAAGLGLAALPGLARAEACRADLARLALTSGGAAQFSIEIADDEAERSQGLMNRDHLARGAGMLFVYPTERPVAFWMRNTLIPLDMIFIDARGAVVHVHANATPHDETPIPSGAPVRFVLEINGGLAQAIGIGPGAVLRHPAIAPDLALAPCD
ncbi:MAG: DUF192 domain-containing protein [Sphingomonadales bacterium]|nr:DUF192 domain-containing protein [Sphingomonadales bacterium]